MSTSATDPAAAAAAGTSPFEGGGDGAAAASSSGAAAAPAAQAAQAAQAQAAHSSSASSSPAAAPPEPPMAPPEPPAAGGATREAGSGSGIGNIDLSAAAYSRKKSQELERLRDDRKRGKRFAEIVAMMNERGVGKVSLENVQVEAFVRKHFDDDAGDPARARGSATGLEGVSSRALREAIARVEVEAKDEAKAEGSPFRRAASNGSAGGRASIGEAAAATGSPSKSMEDYLRRVFDTARGMHDEATKKTGETVGNNRPVPDDVADSYRDLRAGEEEGASGSGEGSSGSRVARDLATQFDAGGDPPIAPPSMPRPKRAPEGGFRKMGAAIGDPEPQRRVEEVVGEMAARGPKDVPVVVEGEAAVPDRDSAAEAYDRRVREGASRNRDENASRPAPRGPTGGDVPGESAGARIERAKEDGVAESGGAQVEVDASPLVGFDQLTRYDDIPDESHLGVVDASDRVDEGETDDESHHLGVVDASELVDEAEESGATDDDGDNGKRDSFYLGEIDASESAGGDNDESDANEIQVETPPQDADETPSPDVDRGEGAEKEGRKTVRLGDADVGESAAAPGTETEPAASDPGTPPEMDEDEAQRRREAFEALVASAMEGSTEEEDGEDEPPNGDGIGDGGVQTEDEESEREAEAPPKSAGDEREAPRPKDDALATLVSAKPVAQARRDEEEDDVRLEPRGGKDAADLEAEAMGKKGCGCVVS